MGFKQNGEVSGFSSCLLLRAAPGIRPHVGWLSHITALPDDEDQIKSQASLLSSLSVSFPCSLFLSGFFSLLFSSFGGSNEILGLNISY